MSRRVIVIVIMITLLALGVLMTALGVNDCSHQRCRFGRPQWMRYYGCMCVERPAP